LRFIIQTTIKQHIAAALVTVSTLICKLHQITANPRDCTQ